MMESRDAYTARAKAQLDHWNAEMDRWQVKSQDLSAEARKRYEEQMGAALKHRDQAAAKLAEMQAIAGEAWVGMRQGVDDAWGSLRDSLNKVKSTLS